LIGGKDQKKVFALFLGTFLIKIVFSNFVSFFEIKETRFLLNNSFRIFQHLFLSVIITKYIYKDHRAIIPILINTMIVLLYSLSNIAIFYDSWSVQFIIFDYKLIFGSMVILSFIDYGEGAYNGIFGDSVNINNKYIRSFDSIPNYENNLQKKGN
jgi:hypothetical protein